MLLYQLVFWLSLVSSAQPKYDHIDEHALYVSVLEISEDSVGGTIKLKVFADDLEDAIYNKSKIRPDLQHEDCNKSNIEVASYLKSHLLLSINSNKIDYSYAGCELNDISLWITYQFKYDNQWQSVEIEADYLMELFPTQSNVVSLNYRDEKRMFRLLKGATKKQVEF